MYPANWLPGLDTDFQLCALRPREPDRTRGHTPPPPPGEGRDPACPNGVWGGQISEVKQVGQAGGFQLPRRSQVKRGLSSASGQPPSLPRQHWARSRAPQQVHDQRSARAGAPHPTPGAGKPRAAPGPWARSSWSLQMATPFGRGPPLPHSVMAWGTPGRPLWGCGSWELKYLKSRLSGSRPHSSAQPRSCILSQSLTWPRAVTFSGCFRPVSAH